MNRFIKTFYLWLGVATLCNLATLLSACMGNFPQDAGLWLYPAAWLMQLPLVAVVASIHHGTNQVLHLLPARHAKKGHWLVCALILFVVTGGYLASQIMRTEVDAFLSWDMLRVGLSDTKQILPDIGRRMGLHLFLLSSGSIVAGLLYVRQYHNPRSQHSTKLFTILLVLLACGSASSYAFAFNSAKESAWRARNEILPTTYLAASLLEDILLENMVHDEAIKNIVLPQQVELGAYLKNSPPQSMPHVFFIMLEAIPWDHFPFTGYPRADVTPNLNALARDSLIFPRTYATANHSSYSQPSIHSSQYPLRTTSLDQYDTVDYPKTLLFDILAGAGYQTAFISAQNEDWLGMKRFILAHTHLQYFLHSKDELGNNIDKECKIDDSLVCTRAIEYLDNRTADEPVFMYLNLQRTHFPYDIPENAPHPYQPCGTDEFKFTFYSYDQDHQETVVNKFDNALHYVDAQVGRFITYLKQRGLYENSLIVVSADHGEAFYQHGYPTHSTTLYDSQVRVCTLIKQPMQHNSSVRDDAISLIDINPTILEVLGMENHPNFQGQQVLENPRNNPIYILSHGVIKAMGIVEFPWKYFKSETRHPVLVNLETDPSEVEDLSSQYPEKLMELKEEVEWFRQQQLYYYQDISSEEREKHYPPRL